MRLDKEKFIQNYLPMLRKSSLKHSIESSGININGLYILRLRFADDIVILTESLSDLK